MVLPLFLNMSALLINELRVQALLRAGPVPLDQPNGLYVPIRRQLPVNYLLPQLQSSFNNIA